MKNSLDFLINIGRLKGKKRRGWEIHKIKNSETTAEHIFHLAFLVWILGKDKKLDMERTIKMALVHDLCEIYSKDFTAYDAAAIKKKGRISAKEFLKLRPKTGRPTYAQRKQMELIKQKEEKKAMKKVISNLPINSKNEIMRLWMDYENGLTKEGRFVKQADDRDKSGS